LDIGLNLPYQAYKTIPDTIEVDWIVGAYVLVKKEVLRKVVYWTMIFLCMPKKWNGVGD
jgi:hypothetical protein